MRLKSPPISREDGFTLLEVLIAFVILSGATGIIYQMLASGSIGSARAKAESEAVLIGKTKMAEAALTTGVNQGEIGDYRWTSIVTDSNQSKDRDTTRLLNIQVVVAWDGFNGEREISFETLKLLPRVD